MTELRKAAEMALEALDGGAFGGYRDMVVETLRQALTQHVDNVYISEERVHKTEKSIHEPVAFVNGYFGGYLTITCFDSTLVLPDGLALYTAPPISDYHEGWEEGFKAAKREWVGLTDEEKYDVLEGATGDGGRVYYDTLFRSYEAKLKEKNNA